MDGISASSSRSKDYSFDGAELDELHKDRSTAEMMDIVRKDAGYTQAGTIHGDDKSSKELKEEYKSKEAHEGPCDVAKDIGRHAGLHVAEHALFHVGARAAAGLVLAAGPLLMGTHLVKKANEGISHKEALVAALNRDEARLAMMAKLDLPKGFMTKEVERCEAASANGKAGRFKLQEQLDGKDQNFKPVLQMHCDRGQHAALDVLKSGVFKPGMTSEALLKERPNIAAAYKQDAAFRAGFDGLLWAKANSPKEFEAAVQSLGARDAAYAKNHIRVQG